jgi:hypothetical protein
MSRNLMTNHGQSFRLIRKGKPVPGDGPASCRRADWSLGLSALGLLIVPVVGSVAGVVLGGLAFSQMREQPELTGRGRAMGGIVLGVVGVLVWAGMLARRFG